MIELSLNEYHGPKKMLPKVKKKMRDCKPGWMKNSLRIDSRTASGTDSSTERSTDKPGKLSWRFTLVWMYTIAKAFFSSSGKIRFRKYPLSAASADSPFSMFAAICFAWKSDQEILYYQYDVVGSYVPGKYLPTMRRIGRPFLSGPCILITSEFSRRSSFAVSGETGKASSGQVIFSFLF